MEGGSYGMCTKVISVLNCLANAKSEYVTSFQLSTLLNASTRTVLRYIQEAQGISTENGFEICSHKGRGYTLTITDKDKFEQLICASNISFPLQTSERTLMQVATFILANDNIKLDDLAEKFNYSRSSMSRITVSIARLFDGYSVKLEGKAHAGLTIQGSEIAIRKCMCYFFFSNTPMKNATTALGFPESLLTDVKQCVDTFTVKGRLRYTVQGYEQFLQYLFVTVNRVRSGHDIRFECHADLAKAFLIPHSFKFVEDLLFSLLRCVNGKHPAENEVIYLALIWDQFFSSPTRPKRINVTALLFIKPLVQKSLEKIQEKYGSDFMHDANLVDGLVNHVSTCFCKYLLGLETDNPFLIEARKNYPSAYYYSIEMSECIWEQTKIRISNNELGYIALYFASSIERNEKRNKFRVVILCHTAFGTAALLKSLISNQYEEINVISVSAMNDAKNIRSDVDFYITTIPMQIKSLNGKPVLLLSPFLNDEDKTALAKMLAGISQKDAIQNICSPDRFFIIEKAFKKNELLETLIDRFVRQGLITESEKQAIFSREALVSTEIAANIAMPHCIIHGPSFISFCMLRTPVMWGKSKISLVIIGCFHEGDAQIKELLSQLFRIVTDERKVAKLLASTNYDEFLENLKKCNGD